MSRLLIVSSDLMLVSRLEGLAHGLSLKAMKAGDSKSALAMCDEQTSVVIVDLQLADLDIKELKEQLTQAHDAVSIVASGPHVHTKSLAAAEAAGCDLVLSRGQLDRDGAALLSKLLSN